MAAGAIIQGAMSAVQLGMDIFKTVKESKQKPPPPAQANNVKPGAEGAPKPADFGQGPGPAKK